MRRPWCAPLLVVLLAGPAACADDEPKEGEARLEVDGVATVERADGDVDRVDGGTDVRSGDRVTIEDGAARMQLRGGTELELREAFQGVANTSVLMAKRPVLEAGDLLVVAPKSAGLEADGTEVEVTRGSARLTRAFGMSVAAYDADVALDSAGVAAEVPALRQMVVPDLGRPPQKARPIRYDERDRWDRRYLGAAMDLGERLEAMATGLTRFLPEGEGRTPGFFRLVLPGLEDESVFDEGLLRRHRDGKPGDTLVGAAITDLGRRGDFRSRWNAVFSFHDEGAAWGIVALDQAVRSEPLVGSVTQALDAFDEVAGSGGSPSATPGGTGTTPGTTPTGGEDPAGGGTDGGTDGGTGGTGGTGGIPPTTGGPLPTTPPTTTPGTPPTTVPTVPDPPPVLDPVVDPITDLLDDLVGGLLGGGPIGLGG